MEIIMKNIALLGSTGSIGTQTLEIVKNNPDRFRVTSLAAGSNIDLLERQVRQFGPAFCCVYDEKAAGELKVRLADTATRVCSGMDGLIEVASDPESEMLVTGIVGMIGIRPTIAAIKAGKDIALANKETLVCAGHIIMPLSREMGVKILPVDSEHSAIFQSLGGFWYQNEEHHRQIDKILLTASGGPFRGMKRDALKGVGLDRVLKHPNWDMGPKVTIDSASLVNKGLELMEASWLFDVPADRIEILIHPESVLHSAVQFIDGAVMGQMGVPDMKLPIQYALTYPDRIYLKERRLDLFEMASLNFQKPDEETFRGLHLAKRAARQGGSMPTVFNAANEVAVRRLLKGEIEFLQIPEIIEAAMDAHSCIENPTVEDILDLQTEITGVN